MNSRIDPRVVAALVDERTGILRRVERRPVPAHVPRSFTLVRSVIADSSAFSDWVSDTAGAGYTFGDPDAALAAAVGEGIERYCAHLIPPGLRVARHRDVDGDAIDPATIALYSRDQYAQPGFPFAPLDADTVTEWADGADLLDRRPMAVPAALVWPGHHRLADRPLAPVLQAGLAAGPTRQIAEQHALAEVIERDAMTLGWTGRAGLRPVEPPPWLSRLARGPHRRLEASFLAFPNEFDVPVIGALLSDPETGRLGLGTGCRSGPVAAALKALGEALQLLLLLGEYDDPAGPFAAAARHPTSPLSPWRADRSYLAQRRDDLRDVVDYGAHLQLALDPAYQKRFADELAEAVRDRTPWALPDEDTGDTPDLVRRSAERGHRPVSVDLTTPDVRSAGLTVVRVVVPGLYGNAAAGLPFLGGERMRRALNGRPYRALPLPH
ncbi:YcaO-like family protein [Cryptosporangium arvum]|uniref:Bacteriocin biosynthesis docking scaffold, SagD family n=1 Tax=Cryptosporangium arvum DSM 44712 TaxID=927661 RepID=A0A010ZTE8_9ACTN|nr:YcaO-like family protein [Cryptosporangium arvum]EXG80502.1 bacteriocin biosynthesis docking scaffold, SagD family [Cryptosporangium arvum DSM 44712]